jgi:hypothetical protein
MAKPKHFCASADKFRHFSAVAELNQEKQGKVSPPDFGRLSGKQRLAA